MCLEIVGEFSCGLHDCQDGLFEGEVANLCLMQRFTYVVDGSLCVVVFPDQHQTYCVKGYRNIGKQYLVGFWTGHD